MSTRNLTAVEGLRFLLFLGVFVFHCVSRWLPIGWGGVEAFLVIASYFLTRKYLNHNNETIVIGQTFLHRIKRLYPVYMTIVLFFTVACLLYSGVLKTDVFWYIFSAQNFRCLFENASWSLDCFLGHFWYISLDVWLFLLWVILLRFVPRKHLKTAFVISLLIGIFWRTFFIIYVPENISIAYMIPVGMLDSWALGGLVALNMQEKGENKKVMWMELAIGLLGIVLLTLYNASLHKCGFGESYQLYSTAKGYMHNPLTGNTYFFIALLSAGLLRYCTDTNFKHPFFSAGPLVVLGGMTYELYCFHFPVRYAAKHFIQDDVLMVVVALIATYIVTVLWNKLAMPIVHKFIK